MSNCMLNLLHSDILKLILFLLTSRDKIIARFVCSRWNKLLVRRPNETDITLGYYKLSCDDFIETPELIRWAVSKGYAFTFETCVIVSDIRTLEYIRSMGAPWSINVLLNAAEKGYLNILQWAKSERYFIDNGQLIPVAVRGGHLSVVQWLCTTKQPYTRAIGEIAAEEGHLHILEWLYTQGIYWDESIGKIATKKGHLHILQAAYRTNQHHKWDFNKLLEIAFWSYREYVDMVKWLVSIGCNYQQYRSIGNRYYGFIDSEMCSYIRSLP